MKNKNLTGHKILIVEDDFSSRLYLNKILEKTGAVLLNAEDGQSAVKCVIDNPDIDIVLMDIQLPVMDGFDSATRIRALKKDVIIIAQTAYGLQADRQRISESVFNDFMIKPIFPQKLVEKIAGLIAARK